jgi:membrane fusion protein, heavy metal efflux system
MNERWTRIIIVPGIGVGIGLVVGLTLGAGLTQSRGSSRERTAPTASESAAESRPRSDADAVTVDELQAQRLRIEPVQLREFRDERTTVGRIAFNDDRTTAIFAPFQGRVLRLSAKPGDVLRPGSPLLAIDSPDLVQANADLIAASTAVQKGQNQVAQAERVARRQQLLYEGGAAPYKDLEQADSDLRNARHDLKTAEGQLEAARNRLRAPFGKSDTEIAQIEATHDVDRVAQIVSPIAGTVTARKVSPGQFVRADNTDPMFTIADVLSMWLVANVTETDIPLIKVGQEVAVRVMAYPGEVFRARIAYVGASVDPVVHRLTVRAEIANPDHRLKPDMFASFRIMTGVPARSVSIPTEAVLRESNGTMAAWVTTDGRRLLKRTIKLGLQQDGFSQVLEGLQAGELVATASALFLGNVLSSGEASD